eukprot:TRINITY_DN9893_c0_g1_i24.p1 TRINITY_DN9893_c0_g1~~TRINITY_DN9893_c0_g1_i24.p1  ORF type:complete len:243 (+),score=81.91 TRINITY_DN9893_c0_g1_i24:1063-1791(+)
MLMRVASLFLYSEFDGMKLEIGEFLKGLLNPEIRDLKDEFFDLFYSRILPVFVDFLTTSKDAFAAALVVEILTMCATTHGFRVRHYVTHNAVLQTLLPLFSSPSKALRLAMIKLFRTFISLNDENLNKYVVRHDLLRPVFKCLESNKRDNMILSACLDLLDQIVSKDMTNLLIYTMSKYRPLIAEGPFASNSTMERLKLKYELAVPIDRLARRENLLARRGKEMGQKKATSEEGVEKRRKSD